MLRLASSVALICLFVPTNAFLTSSNIGLTLRTSALSLRSASHAVPARSVRFVRASQKPAISMLTFVWTRTSEISMIGKLGEKYGHLRGKDVEPCDRAVERFYKLFGKPVPFVFRSATNEILYMSHLDLVNAMFEKDLIWTTGLYSTFDVFFQAIDEKTRNELFNSLVGALKLDPAQVKSDAEQVLSWATGKTEADVVAAFNGEDQSPVGLALARIRANPDFLYTRNFGAGLIKIMQVVGTEPNAANAKRWSEAAAFSARASALTGISMSKFEADVGTFLSSVEKMQQVLLISSTDSFRFDFRRKMRRVHVLCRPE